MLSGTGSDGALGVRHVKEMGGFSIAQVPEDAEFSPMPRAAIDTGCIDLILPVVDIGQRLVELVRRTEAGLPSADTDAGSSTREDSDPPTGESPLSEILSQLRFHTRQDFRHYKRSTVLRRIARRMQVNRVVDLAGYRDLLASNPKEAAPLLQDMLISVTSFFRDPEAFAALKRMSCPRCSPNPGPTKTSGSG